MLVALRLEALILQNNFDEFTNCYKIIGTLNLKMAAIPTDVWVNLIALLCTA